ncbi:hypothetical protein CH380_09710 [Leptospira adleri]|uniref:M23ase beta-sheet core domain-containing protein n=2 Tax=Leptospira adleri TaxID=2023186 RepID=A0A2M9YPK3_9LEPT|nr:hypothetical protein CH380_09710 [Leptospira adleri]PJZ63040.1 hypothetical protein CH376_05070 [Leptospira adleri]
MTSLLFLPLFSCFSFKKTVKDLRPQVAAKPPCDYCDDQMQYSDVLDYFEVYPEYTADGFDFPVCYPNGIGCKVVNPFGFAYHLGEGWMKNRGNSFGSPIHAIGNGIVKTFMNAGPGWGDVVIITHKLPDGQLINSLYGHFSKVYVKKGDLIKRGQIIGLVGDANRHYEPHLHFEIRDEFFMLIEGGYSRILDGCLDPRKFISAHRKLLPMKRQFQ